MQDPDFNRLFRNARDARELEAGEVLFIDEVHRLKA